MQTRRNVQVGSHNNQSKPRTGTDGFLHHTRLGLVGWISYWCLGDSALTVDILVVLINTLGLTELVSDALASRKQKSRPPAPPIVSPCKGIMSCFSFLFLGVPSHYARRSFNCWWTVCARVCGRGHGSNSCGPNLMVEGCTRTKQTFWTEDEFTVTASSGIRNRDVRVPEIVVREVEKAKPDKWGCVQTRELW
jgi:hypothetical protein